MENSINNGKNFFQFLQEEQILQNELMANHTTFRIGGKADIMLLPKSIDEIKRCVECCKKNKIDYYVIGNGSNLLVSDKGFKGAIIKILKNFNNIEIKDNSIKAQAGATLASIARLALNQGLTGLEFLAGIPGTIGGGVCMNAGAYGIEIKDILKTVTVLKEGEIIKLDNAQCQFEYRNSRILKEKLIVLEVELLLQKGNKDEITEKMNNITKNRREKQPLEYPSAGSTFKRPLNNFAGKLIMEAGLAGESIGGAVISEKHCGFIVNKGAATFEDVLSLMELATKIVKEKFDVNLENEVRIIGER